ncbi:MAG: hypothetical protein COB53_10065 [Elusimicrobia bacterium]|nr:MAG: hypothetical protein COB53_10065 [Elusimicrobiota bacterium]
MIVVAIIGILAAIAIPKFANLVRKSQEGQTRGNLGALRSAISIYYSDMEGFYPTGPAGTNSNELQDSLTTNGKYLSKFPSVKTPPYHADISTVDSIPTGDAFAADATGEGEWVYTSIATDANWGMVQVECYHTDTKGSVWTTY